MAKTLTMRLDEETYDVFVRAARAERRSLANLIETAALKQVQENTFADDAEMAEILARPELVKRLKAGSKAQRAVRLRVSGSLRPGNFRRISPGLARRRGRGWKPSSANTFTQRFAKTPSLVRTSNGSATGSRPPGGTESPIGASSTKFTRRRRLSL